MTDWNPDVYAFIADCDAETLAVLKAQAIASIPGLNASGRMAMDWLDPRKSPRLAKLIYEQSHGGPRIESFLGIKPPQAMTVDEFGEDL